MTRITVGALGVRGELATCADFQRLSSDLPSSDLFLVVAAMLELHSDASGILTEVALRDGDIRVTIDHRLDELVFQRFEAPF